jgi:hypothetical protein
MEQQNPGENKNWSLAVPLVTAIIAALIAFISNIYATYLSGRNEIAVERQKLQATLIIEAVKTGDTNKDTRNLEFFLKA